MNKAFIVLQDGTVFEGFFGGKVKEVCGDIVFNTAMVGYVENLTDKSYDGKIMVQTFPLANNYGVNKEDMQSRKVKAAAYVVKYICDEPSNFRSQCGLIEFLDSQNVPAVVGVNTRALTRHLRENGVMKAAITQNPNIDLQGIKNYKKAVTQKNDLELVAHAITGKFNVTLLDCGANKSVADILVQHGCQVTILPCSADQKQIADSKPDGIVLAGGAAKISECSKTIETIKKIKDKYKIFGINDGHILLAAANGGKTVQLERTHCGANIPVKNLFDGSVFVTSQNHSVAVDAQTVNGGKMLFQNINDKSCEGIVYDNGSFTVQFNPESSPLDARFLFGKFIELMEKKNA